MLFGSKAWATELFLAASIALLTSSTLYLGSPFSKLPVLVALSFNQSSI